MTPLLRILLLLLLAASLGAQTQPPRYALVIGNGDYPFASLGQTPASDAGAMRDALTLAGFQVDYFTNLDQTKLSNAVTAFGRKIKDTKGVALFYYSGHGVQHNNQNYLVPIGAELTDEEDIEGLCIPINRITAKMQGAGTTINLVVLDACRAFPLSRAGKTLTQGLNKENYAVPELLVAYATAPGSTATVRGEGGLSLYTSQLLKHLKTPGLVLENVLKNTRRDVITKSNGQQRPDETGNLTADFYFFPATAQSDETPAVLNGKEVSPTLNPIAQDTNTLFSGKGREGIADRDLDGIPDATDVCPDDYGILAANGCPDYDEDGVPNSVDKCPNLVGTKAWQGCPDADGDGIPDHEDLCPTAKGTAIGKGCPDLSQYGYGPDDFVRVAGGTFQMGSNKNADEKPFHSVTVPTFEMGKYEVTNAQFCLFINDIANAISISSDGDAVAYKGKAIFENFCGDKKGGCDGFIENIEYSGGNKTGGRFNPVSGYENNPAVMINWHGATAYCEWLSQKTGQTYHLPSEAEWEYAARGGNQSKGYGYAGSNTLSDVGWYISNSGSKSHPVGEKLGNELGLYDMSGNVWEWCADTWHDSYTGAPADGSAWASKASQNRFVLRGGSWDNNDFNCRSSYRHRYSETFIENSVGFRVARAVVVRSK